MTRRPNDIDDGYAHVPSNLGDAHPDLSDPYSTQAPLTYNQNSLLQQTASPSPVDLTRITTSWTDPQPIGYREHLYTAPQHHGEPGSPESPIDPAALQFALPPNISQAAPSRPDLGPEPPSADAFAAMSTAYYDEHSHFDAGDSDRIPLTASAEPISGARDVSPAGTQARASFQTTSDLEDGHTQGRASRMLGFDLNSGYATGGRHHSYGSSLAPDSVSRRSRTASTSGALQRTASIMRAMSQRVVDISGGGEALEQQALRERSRSPNADGRRSHHLSGHMTANTSYQPQVFTTPREKKNDSGITVPEPRPFSDYRPPMPNPLKGKSLGIFSADNPLRLWLCDLLMLPWVESLILVLIVLQAVLLAVEAAPDVWSPGNGRSDRWGKTPYDWAMLGLFIVFTIEIIVRIIVSGFIFNAAEYSTIDRKKGMRDGIRAAVTDQYRSFFQPQRQRSVKRPPVESYGPSSFSRSFTLMQGQPLPETFEEQQRMQLARRAFLRHSFSRLDFVAVVSFWISFVLSITGIEYQYHLYVFRMLSCLRIVRLLGITKGNAVSTFAFLPSMQSTCTDS